MANLRTMLEDAERALGERIEAIVVGKHYRADWEREPAADENVVLSRELGLAKVDAEYDNGYGGADCFPFYAWTPRAVLFVSEYDGATGLACVPRLPMPIEPQFSGGDPADLSAPAAA